MSSVTLYRASGLALLLGSVLFIIGVGLSFVFTPDTPLWFVMGGVWTGGAVLMLLGLSGIAARQASRAGWSGFVGAILTFSGVFLIASYNAVTTLTINPWLDAHAPKVEDLGLYFTNPALTVFNSVAITLLVIGLVLLGSATMRARVFPQGTGLLLIAAVVVSGIGLVISLFGLGAVATVASLVSLVLLLIGLGWMGYALWTTKGEAVPQPALAS